MQYADINIVTHLYNMHIQRHIWCAIIIIHIVFATKTTSWVQKLKNELDAGYPNLDATCIPLKW